MTNHIHFIVTGEDTDAISNTMKVVGSCYAQAFNRRYQRTGSLWEGRHRSSLIDSECYLLACYRYVELNPVRAGMVETPDSYPWSSDGFNATACDGWLKSTRCLSGAWCQPRFTGKGVSRDGEFGIIRW